MKEFKINKYITLKLVGRRTNIYVDGQLFNQCKSIFLNIPIDKITKLDKIESIEETIDKLDLIPDKQKEELDITPEIEFWAHCSNLQVWVENDYDTRLIHSNLAFPLLKKLYEAKDPLAKRVFKEEIIKRFKSGYPTVIRFLICEDYMKLLSKDELDRAFKNFNYEYLQNDLSLESLRLLEYMIDLGSPTITKTILKENVFRLLNDKSEDHEIITFLVNYDLMSLFTKEELESIKVKEVVLEEPFTSKIPSEIGFLKSLEELFIYSEDAVKELPDTIGDLISLKRLDLHGCDKLEKIPQTIVNLKSLKSLSLPWYISYIPEWIENLTNLEVLELSACNLKVIPQFIKNLQNLKILRVYASYNLKNQDWLKEMSNLEKLEFY